MLCDSVISVEYDSEDSDRDDDFVANYSTFGTTGRCWQCRNADHDSEYGTSGTSDTTSTLQLLAGTAGTSDNEQWDQRRLLTKTVCFPLITFSLMTASANCRRANWITLQPSRSLPAWNPSYKLAYSPRLVRIGGNKNRGQAVSVVIAQCPQRGAHWQLAGGCATNRIFEVLTEAVRLSVFMCLFCCSCVARDRGSNASLSLVPHSEYAECRMPHTQPVCSTTISPCMHDYNCHCAKRSSVPGSHCVCDYNDLLSEIRQYKNGLPAKRRQATCLGILHAFIQEYNLKVVSVALMGSSVSRSLNQQQLLEMS